MTYSGHTTRTVHTVNQSSRQGAKITTIVLHHMASTNLEGTLHMWTAATRVGSANYAIGNEGQTIGVVPEELRAWSLGSEYDGGKGAAFDRHSITFEIENQSLGGSWPVSHAAHEATAQVVADICHRYRIACNRTQILGHREVWTRYHASYPTACPGGLDMDWIVERAKQIAGQGGHPATIASTGSVQADPEHGSNVSSMSTKDVQKLVGADPDGIYGRDTTAKVRVWQKAHGLDADGIFGPLSEAKAKGKPAVHHAPSAPKYPLPADSYFGPKLPLSNKQSVSGYYGHSADLKRWQTQMKKRGWIIDPDGLYGPETAEDARTFQKEKGLTVDGLIGPVTWRSAWTEPIT